MKTFKWEWVAIVAIFLLLCISLMTPFIIVTFFVLAIPMIILYVRTELKWFGWLYTLSLLLTILIFPIMWVYFIVFQIFLLPIIVTMGTRFKNRKPAHSVISLSTITLIMQSLMTLLLFYTVGLDPINRLKQFFIDGMSSMPQEIKSLALMQQQEMIIDLLMKSIPFYIILFSFIYVMISYFISHSILNKMGENLPRLSSYSIWKLPKFLVYVYIIALFIEMVVSLNQDSMLSMVVVNLLLLLTVTFSLQAILFIFFFARQKNWNRMIPVILSFLIIIPYISIIYVFIGIVDTLYPLREKIERN